MMFCTLQGVAEGNTSVTKYNNEAMKMPGKVWTTYFSVYSYTHVYVQNVDSFRLAFKLPEQPCLECCVMLCVWRRGFLFGNRCLLSIPLKKSRFLSPKRKQRRYEQRNKPHTVIYLISSGSAGLGWVC